MSSAVGFKLKPLVFSIYAMSAVGGVLVSQSAAAIPVIGDLVIDSATPVQSYEVSGAGSRLEGTVASTLDITVDAGAQLDLSGSLVSGGSATALTLRDAQATVVGSNINSDSVGLDAGSGSQATVSGSLIVGGNTGVIIDSSSQLHLQNTNVMGTYADSVGLKLQGGSVYATNKTFLRGGNVGVSMNPASSAGDKHTLVLDNSKVEGLTDAAIVVEGGGAGGAQIGVLNGSTLSGGNGTLLEVKSGSAAELLVDNSHLKGNVIVESGSTAKVVLDSMATLIGRLENVSSLALNRQAQWTMVESSQLGNLSMEGGAIKFGDAGSFYTLSVASLEGKGTFVMDADFAQERADFLEVTGNASGNHRLLIGSSGTEPSAQSKLQVVRIDSGDAEFTLATGRVDLGAYSYSLIREGNEWFLGPISDPGTVISPGTRSALGLFNAAPTVWYGEATTLNSRMGDLRINPRQAGLWMRSYGNKFSVSQRSGLAYAQQQHGVSLGADTLLPASAQWLMGLMGGYSQSNLDLRQGTAGKIGSYYLGAYSTWLDDEGYYADGVLKFNRFQNKSTVGMSDGSSAKGAYTNNGLGASLEAGRHIKLVEGYFIEPYAYVSALLVQGGDYRLDNGLEVAGDRAHSVQTKLGVSVGRHFELGEGRLIKPYARTAWAKEYSSRNKVSVNNNDFNNDLSGSTGELGLGVALTLTDRVSLNADVDYSHGEKIRKPYGVNAGLRMGW